MTTVRTEPHGEHMVHVLEDAASGSSARILADYGFNCYSFQCAVAGKRYELIDAAPRFADEPSRASGNGTPILFPFPNRIRDGLFVFDGQQFELPRNERGVNAIHGLVIDRPWRVAVVGAEGRAELRGEFHLQRDAPELASLWPADFVIEMTYSLAGNRLTSRVRVTNPDSRPLPWGFGTHPYFRLPIGSGGEESQCSVQAPAAELWELADLLPTGRKTPIPAMLDLRDGRPMSELKVDHVFSGLTFVNGWCTCQLTDHAAGIEVTFRFDQLFRDLVIYIPPRRGTVCLEPYTCVTDAINLQARGIDSGLRVLMPGESAEGTMVLEAGVWQNH